MLLVVEVIEKSAVDFTLQNFLNRVHHRPVLVRDKRQRIAVCIYSSGTPYPMDISVRVFRHIIIYDMGNVQYVDSPGSYIRSHQYFYRTGAKTVDCSIPPALR
jgi:hypothetical protein